MSVTVVKKSKCHGSYGAHILYMLPNVSGSRSFEGMAVGASDPDFGVHGPFGRGHTMLDL